MSSSSNEEKSWVKIVIAIIGIVGTIGTSLVANEFFLKQFGSQSTGDSSQVESKSAASTLEEKTADSHQLALKEFSRLADYFNTLAEPNLKEQRNAVDDKIRQLAEHLTLEDIRKYSRESRRWGYRAASGRALSGLLAASPSLVEQEYDRLVEIIDYNLGDSSGYVRYRYVVVLRENPELARRFKKELQHISTTDSSQDTRETANKILKRLL